ncbi:hypothetical protein [Pyrobaculum sp.]|uniref:hypothetical protein n=1 Tax=Pyrobaculum sp. TaxID=2004705 RepID=UPI003D0B3BBD
MGIEVLRTEPPRAILWSRLVYSSTISYPQSSGYLNPSREKGRGWVINGIEMWITDGLYADYYLVAARTGPREARAQGNYAVSTAP